MPDIPKRASTPDESTIWAELSDAMAALPDGFRVGDGPLSGMAFSSLSASALVQAMAADFDGKPEACRTMTLRLAALSIAALDHHDRLAARRREAARRSAGHGKG